ncbi:MAG: GNAT family N-acetyltransferase [Chloroflexi bacterium]|nr:GNAT family N-acetyltransferase [Chloroflexota bacterium]MCC6892183.1 GNAT family N-acetyltransferase [Anaerolineae bacterium]
MQPKEPELRLIKPDDIPAVVRLMEKIGWNHPVEQTKQYIGWGGSGSFCLAFADEIVATAIALKYNQRLAWVGLVISDPDYQRRGFARRLMNHVMSYLEGVESVMLDASVAGFPIYDKMGFQSLYKINAYCGTPQVYELPSSVRAMTEADIEAVVSMDCKTHGIARPHIIRWLFETGKSYVTTENGLITGYAFTKRFGDTLRAIAWNANSRNAADHILRACSTEAAQGNFHLRINVPEPNIIASDLAEAHQLTIERYVTRMVYGQPPPGKMGEQYGIITFMTG